VSDIEDSFRAIADSAPILMWMSGTDKGCTFFNQGWLDFTGRPMQDELGNGWSDGVFPDDLDRCLKTYAEAFDARQPFTMEYRLRRRDGQHRWILDRGVPRFAPDTGEFLGYVGSAYDISELKQAEERPRHVLEMAPNGIVVVDEHGAISLVNAAALASFGYSREELIGRSIELLIPDRFRPGHPAARQAYSASPERRPMGAGRELFGRRKDGSEFPVEVGLTPIQTSEGSFVLASVIDITARRAAERAVVEATRQLEQEKQLLEAVIENIPGMFFMVDRQRQRVRWNKERERLTGYSAEEMAAMPAAALVAPEDRARLEGIVERAFQGDRVTSEHIVVAKDGRRIPVLGNGARVTIAGEDYFIGVVLDVSPLKQAEEELRRALAEIEALKGQLELENTYLRQQVAVGQHPDGMVGQSKPIMRVAAEIDQVASTGATVLVLGETGVGKELVARAIHRLSPRHDRALVKVNCAALPSTLVESELFGREKGAYTGALTRQAGRFEIANRSTIFLDEVAELPLELQAKLLRVLQDGEFERLGSTTTMKVDVRVIAATNRDLLQEVRAGRFREDLFYRLNVFPIRVPPLRERPEDIPLLAWTFVREFERASAKRIESIPRRMIEALSTYHWPGNVRELRNVVERAMIVSRGPVLHLEVPPDVTPSPHEPRSTRLADIERQHIVAILERVQWRIRGPHGAASALGLKPTTLEARMARLGIQRGQTPPLEK
jgi:PAS domain S-box-containing protein